MTHQTWHLLVILGLPSLQDYKKQLSVVYQLVYGIYNSSPKRRRQGSLMVKDREAWRAVVHVVTNSQTQQAACHSGPSA